MKTQTKTFKNENVELENIFFFFKWSTVHLKITSVATLAVSSSHCWTRDYERYGNKPPALKTTVKLKTLHDNL